MKITILTNPSSGGGKARHALAEALEVLRRAGAEVQVLPSESAGHLSELARQARDARPDVVAAAGGDGTVHHVLNGLFPGPVPLGIIPLGRGNDLARSLGIPTNPCQASEVLLRGQTREIDLARVCSPNTSEARPQVYACIAGVGFDSVVTRYANQPARRLHGRFAYVWGILRCLWSFQPQPLEITSDTQDFSGDIMFAVVGNNSTYGDGVKMCPRARLDDGLLDVCIVPKMGKLELLSWVRRAYRGEHLAHPRMRYFQVPRLVLKSAARLELFGDGEYLQDLPATIETIPRALKVIVGGKNASG